MTFANRLKNLFKPDSPSSLPVFYPAAYVPSDLRLSPDQALSLSAVWGCVRVISEAIASSPWEVYQRVDGVREELPDDPLAWLLNNRPNNDTTAQALKEALLVQSLIFGSGYLQIVKDVVGRVQSLHLLATDRIRVYRAGDPGVPEGFGKANRLVYSFHTVPGVEWFEDTEIFHLRGPSANSLLGDGLVTRAARAAALAWAQDTFALGHYDRGAYPSAVLKFDGMFRTEEDRKRALASAQESLEGAKNAGKSLLLEKGWEFTSMPGTNIEQSQVIQARQFSVEDIARFFGVPLHLLNVLASSQGYGTNLSSVGLEFVRQTLTPWRNRVEQEANFKLFAPRTPKYLCIDLSRLTTGDQKNQAETAKIWLECGVKTVNEVREEQGLDTIGDEGDLHIIPSGFMGLDEENLSPVPEPTTEPTQNEPEPSQNEPDQQDGGDNQAADPLTSEGS